MKVRKKIRRPVKSSRKDEHKPFLGVQAKTLLNQTANESQPETQSEKGESITDAAENRSTSAKPTSKKAAGIPGKTTALTKQKASQNEEKTNGASKEQDEKNKELSEGQISAAITYNTPKFKKPEDVKSLRKALGLSTDSIEMNDELVKAVAAWQVSKGLTEDGKVGPITAASIGYAMFEEAKKDPSLKPAAISMLERGIVISFSGNSYSDSATKSLKNIKFIVNVPKGLKREDYALVNWNKGYMKKGDGTYFKAKDYGIVRDANYPTYQVDSLDTDPVYWSEPGNRWMYNKEGSTRFTATDSPGQAESTEYGADYNLQFKLQVYRLADIPVSTSGTLGGAESKAIATVFWEYKTKVSATGKFTH